LTSKGPDKNRGLPMYRLLSNTLDCLIVVHPQLACSKKRSKDERGEAIRVVLVVAKPRFSKANADQKTMEARGGQTIQGNALSSTQGKMKRSPSSFVARMGPLRARIVDPAGDGPVRHHCLVRQGDRFRQATSSSDGQRRVRDDGGEQAIERGKPGAKGGLGGLLKAAVRFRRFSRHPRPGG